MLEEFYLAESFENSSVRPGFDEDFCLSFVQQAEIVISDGAFDFVFARIFFPPASSFAVRFWLVLKNHDWINELDVINFITIIIINTSGWLS